MKHCTRCQRNWASGKICPYCDCELTAGPIMIPKPATDTERLNWLIDHGAYVSHSSDGEACNVWYAHDPSDDAGAPGPVGGFPQKCYLGPREAIDAAMVITKGQR